MPACKQETEGNIKHVRRIGERVEGAGTLRGNCSRWT